MRIAVLSDIHGNFPALERVTDHIENWKPDLVFVAGDIVNRGPRSHDCLKFLNNKKRESGWGIIRGNHEDYVISRADPEDPKSGPVYDLYQPTHYIYAQLNYDVSRLVSLPEIIAECGPDQREVRMVHASMRHNRDGIYPETGAVDLGEQIYPPPAVFITGHTHRPLVRKFGGTLVVNAGSVGLPFDGDRRTGYAQITYHKDHWDARIIRLEYDIAQAEKDFYDTGYLEGAGPIAKIVLLELELAFSQLWHWSARYTMAILDERMTVEESTREFLKDPITKPYW
jgi:predicted phosphodiesterase